MSSSSMTLPATLAVAERCDRCGAAAFVRAAWPGGADLLFCRHHGTALGPNLVAAGAEVISSSEPLLERSGAACA